MKEALGTIGALATLPGFVIYLRGVFRGNTRPHAFSWLIWSSLNAIAFGVQITEHGGAGSLVSAAVCLGTFTVFVSALFRGEKVIVLSDWICLGGAALSALTWVITNRPLLSVVLITVIDAFGSFPTFRKAFHKPREESIVLYALDSAAFVAALIALERRSFETTLFPAFVTIVDATLVVMILLRRQLLGVASPHPEARVSP
ncbi:MAG: hypothetical protein ACRDQZ_12575 [Mycobacteriales bacterium]